jgi:Cu-processing system permease protein
MLNAIRLVAAEQFLLLRRDKIFIPAIAVAAAVAAVANIASDWSVEDFAKVLYDIGYFGFQFTGSLVALYWGVKSVNDSRQEGSIELELAAPVGRASWLLGKYLGLAVSLLLFGGVLTVLWQLAAKCNGFDWMTPAQLSVFGYMILGWLVVAALSVFCASFLGQSIALFVALSLWCVGLVTALISNTLGPDAPAFTQFVVKGLARVWDLQQFNLIDQAMRPSWLGLAELGYRAAYGGLLILSLMTVACLIFQRRDVVG